MASPTNKRSIAKADSIVDDSKVTGEIANRALKETATKEESKKNDFSVQRPVNAREIAKYIYNEMANNSSPNNAVAKKISSLLERYKRGEIEWGGNSTHNVGGRYLFDAMMIWKNQVGYGKPWDHKEQIRGRWGKESSLDGIIVQWDVWSNIHYGYVGMKLGFERQLLLDAAGIAQAISSEVPDGWVDRWLRGDKSIFEAMDDPNDQNSISIGVKLSSSKLTLDSFIRYLRSNLHRIS